MQQRTKCAICPMTHVKGSRPYYWHVTLPAQMVRDTRDVIDWAVEIADDIACMAAYDATRATCDRCSDTVHPASDHAQPDPLIVATIEKDDAISAHAKWSRSPQARSDWSANRSTGNALGARSGRALARWIVEVAVAGVTIDGVDFEAGTDLTSIARLAS